jgi:vacuolar-type H+-ATPase subunit H
VDATHETEDAMKLRAIGIGTAMAAASVLGVACSSDDVDDAQEQAEEVRDDAAETASDAADEAAETADEGAARAQAEALRTAIRADDDLAEDSARDVDLVQDAIEDLPGDVTVTGLDDEDRDGLDDDGLVTVTVDDSSACVSLPAEGDEIDVSGGAC